MSMQGIGGAGLPPWLRGPTETQRAPDAASRTGEAGAGQRPGTQPTAPSSQGPITPAIPDPEAASNVAPEGVDQELWSLLTSEERAHFARFQAKGGVTYGPTAGNSSRPSVQGNRLDLRI